MDELQVLRCPSCDEEEGRMEAPANISGEQWYRCDICRVAWKPSIGKGLRPDKYRVFDQHGCAIDSFVLRFNQDPAARVALRAYAMATNNGVLARDLDALLNKIERRPQDYPIQGSEGILNKNVSSRHFESNDLSVLVIKKNEDDD